MRIQLLLILISYVAGATPTSYWVARGLYGRDLRKEGSGNLGATNTYRVLGWKAAAPVLVVDMLKGWAPVVLLPLMTSETSSEWAMGYGAAAVVGHMFSFWVGFSGGKGVATSTGVVFALSPWAALIGLGVWLATVLSTGYVSLGSILAAVTLPIAVLLTPHDGGQSILTATVMLAAFIIYAHRGNVQRLIRGEEQRFGKGGKR